MALSRATTPTAASGTGLLSRPLAASLPRVTPILAGIAVLLAVLAIRLYFVLDHAGMWGVDGGAYGLSANAALGNEPTGMDFARPPLAPGWLLAPLVQAFGLDVALKAFAVVASFAILPAFWLLARQALTPWQTVAATFVLSFDWGLAEMFTAGALPMFGFAGIITAMWAIWRMREGRSDLAMIALTLSLPWIAYVNQTSAGIAAYVLPAWTLAVLWQTPDRLGLLRRVTIPAIWGVIIAATAAEYYIGVAPGAEWTRYPGPLVTVYRGLTDTWAFAVIATAVGILATWKGNGFIRSLGLLTLVMGLVCPLVSYDESVMNIFYRSHYLVMAFVAICGVALLARIQWGAWKWLAVAYAVAGVVVYVGGYAYQLELQSKIQRIASTDTVAGLEWIQAQGNTGAIPSNSYSLSLYVSAITRVPSPWTQVAKPPRGYAAQHEMTSCLYGWREGCDWRAAAEAMNVQYLIAETLWPLNQQRLTDEIPDYSQPTSTVFRTQPVEFVGYFGNIHGAPADLWERTAAAPWLELAWEQGTTRVWRVRHG